MKSIFYLTILLLIYNNEGFITNYKNKEFVYKFSNTITASNAASDKVLSLWAYSGILVVQEYDDCKIFKLDNVKTQVFNGERNNINVNETELSDDKKILTEPFGVYFKSLIDVNISVTPNDELWSINMKKSIASSFIIDTSINKAKTDTEQFVFGKCGISLEVINSRSTKIIEKTINRTCVEGPIKQSSNVDWVKYDHFPFQHETKRIYVISKNNCLFSIDSSSNFTLQSSPDVKSTNRIEQNQYFELITTKENTKPLKIHNNTIIKNLQYEYDNTKKVQTNQHAYLENFVNAYSKFKTQMNQQPLRFMDLSTKTPLAEMLSNLKKFDENCLRKLLFGILMGKDTQYYELFLEILPYAGTKPTTNLIKEIIKDEVNILTKIKLLATFPEYIEEINDETVNNFEELLTFGYDELQVRHTAVLSFTTLLSKGIEKNTINKEIVEKYVKKFYDGFSRAQKYQDKMIYLLGLVNINKVPLNAILNIIYNQKESRHIRELAIYGFKNRLNKFGEELFNKFWAIVKHPNESFETRVAALDLLLSCEISEDQFNEIVNFYDRELNNPYDEHLSNYIVTSIISLQNNSGYHHYLGDWATNIFQTKKLRQNLKTWSTGNYRFSFTDDHSNFGLAFQTKLISDPRTNSINVIQLSFNQFAMSMNFGQFHVYLKLEGLLDLMFVKAFLAERSDKAPIPELIALIQQCKYQLRHREDLFIDVVVFSGNRALFALHMDHNNNNSIQSTNWESMIKFITNHKSISYPILNEIEIPSDLGTELKIKYNMQYVKQRELNNFLEFIQNDETAKIRINNKVLSQMTETISSINPLTDVEISVEKLHYDFKILDLPLTVNKKDHSIIWAYKNDNFNWILQNRIYTFVSNNAALKNHCLNCNEIEEIPTGEAKAECVDAEKYFNRCRMDTSIWREKLLNVYPLGVSINLTSTKESEEMEKLRRMKQYGANYQLTEVINSHRGNALTFPFVKPVLYVLHHIYYKHYLDNDLKEISVRSSMLFNEEYTTKIKLIFNDKSINEYDPINIFDENCTLEITNIDKDNYILSGAKLTFRLSNIVATNQIGSNFEVIADILDEGLKKKFCLNHKIMYPNRLTDLLSLEPVKPAESVTTISWDKNVESFDDGCTHYFLKFTEVLSINEKHSEVIKNMNEYKTCKTESVGFKYTPLTKSCRVAHEAASSYRDYVVYSEIYHAGMRNDDDVTNKRKIYEYHHVDDKTISVSISQSFANLLEMHPKAEFLNYEEPSTFANYMSANPTEFVSNSERTCDISSNEVKTFFDEHITIDDNSLSKNVIAFVECTNSSQVGLAVNKIGNINVVFTYWSGQNKISTNIENNEVKVYLNEKEIKENTQNEELKINFIDKDVLFIRSDFIELYYSPISLSIKIPTLFYKYLCGECLQ